MRRRRYGYKASNEVTISKRELKRVVAELQQVYKGLGGLVYDLRDAEADGEARDAQDLKKRLEKPIRALLDLSR